jgi:hypothetical protein
LGVSIFFTKNNELGEAIKYLNLSKEMIQPENLTELAGIYERSSDIYERQGKWKNAFEDQKLKYYYRDSIESKEKFEAISEIQTKFETEKKEAENELLKTEKALQASTIQKQQFTLFGTIGGLLFLGIISFLLYPLAPPLLQKARTLAIPLLRYRLVFNKALLSISLSSIKIIQYFNIPLPLSK